MASDKHSRAKTLFVAGNEDQIANQQRSLYLPLGPNQRYSFTWLTYPGNNGSYKGQFDWVPLRLRVGYWSPFVVMSLTFFYGAIYAFKPQPLDFSATVLDKFDGEEPFAMGMPRTTAIDLCLFLWGCFVVVAAKIQLGRLPYFYLSFTGWSWMLLTSRAGIEFIAWVLEHNNNHRLASVFAIIGSSLRLVAIANASVVCAVWNFILLPLIYFVYIPAAGVNAGKKRRDFLRFNFGFFTTNIHILNFPLAFVNILSGNRVRLFTMSDLWVAYLVILLYSIQYFFVMDRLGLHFYPIFNPRTPLSVVSIFGVLFLYYFIFLQMNKSIVGE